MRHLMHLMPSTEAAALPSTEGSTQVDVSIAIVSWNASPFLGPCLQSILQDGYNSNIEIIIVDNASRDGSADLVERDFPGVVVVRNNLNTGFAKATNQAIRLSRGRYVLLLNPDTLLSPSAIPMMVHFLDQHPRAAAVGPRVLNCNGETTESYAPFPGLSVALRGARIMMTASYNCLLESVPSEPKIVDWICGACMMVRKEALKQVGLLDEGFFMYWEETDLCWRLWKQGWEVYYLPQAHIIHYGAGSSAQVSDKPYLNGLLLNEWIASAHRFLRKHYSPWAWAACFAVAAISILFALIISPVVFIAFPGRRRQAGSILTVYLRAIARQVWSSVQGWFGHWHSTIKSGQAQSERE